MGSGWGQKEGPKRDASEFRLQVKVTQAHRRCWPPWAFSSFSSSSGSVCSSEVGGGGAKYLGCAACSFNFRVPGCILAPMLWDSGGTVWVHGCRWAHFVESPWFRELALNSLWKLRSRTCDRVHFVLRAKPLNDCSLHM